MRYLDLVRAALWGEQAVWPKEETEALLRMNARQGTGALVYPAVLAQEGLSDATRAHMKSVCLHAMQQQVKLQHVLEKAWRALEQADIPAVLLKGASLAALYPQMQQRTWGDVDLFVGKAQYHAACAAMREALPEAGAFKEEREHYKHYNIDVGDVPIELHRVTMGLQHPRDKRCYERIEAYGMAYAEWQTINGLSVRVPEPTFNVLFVFLHSWEHFIGGSANVRQMCDLALLLHHYTKELKPELFEQWLKQLNLLDVWQLYAYNMTQSLGLPRDESLLRTEKVAERAEKMMEELLHGEWAKRRMGERKEAQNRWVRKWGTMQERMKSAERIKEFSPAYARHMNWTTWLHGAGRLFAKDRIWE